MKAYSLFLLGACLSATPAIGQDALAKNCIVMAVQKLPQSQYLRLTNTAVSLADKGDVATRLVKRMGGPEKSKSYFESEFLMMREEPRQFYDRPGQQTPPKKPLDKALEEQLEGAASVDLVIEAASTPITYNFTCIWGVNGERLIYPNGISR